MVSLNMDVSVIILNYKTKELLRRCIEHVRRSSRDIQYEVIVVDNASKDGSVQMVQSAFPDVRIYEMEQNRGFAAGMNFGMRHANGRYMLLMNPDVQVEPNTMQKLLAFLHHEPTVALVGPKLINRDGSTQLSCFRFPSFLVPLYRRSPLGRAWFARTKLRRYLMSTWDHLENRPVDWVLGACMMVRRSALERVGMMDERFFLYFEDTDWCRRFWRSGYRVYYLADAHVLHHHRRLSAESPGIAGIFSYPTRVHIRSWMKYLRKYHFTHAEPLP